MLVRKVERKMGSGAPWKKLACWCIDERATTIELLTFRAMDAVTIEGFNR